MSTVKSAPGSAIISAERSIPRIPRIFLPIPDAISTGRAPGVIFAIITSLLNSSSLISLLFL